MARPLDPEQVKTVTKAIIKNPVGFIPPILICVDIPDEQVYNSLKECNDDEAQEFFAKNATTYPMKVFGSTHTVMAYLMLNKHSKVKDNAEIQKLGNKFWTKFAIIFVNCPLEVKLSLASRHNADADVHKEMSEFETLKIIRNVWLLIICIVF